MRFPEFSGEWEQHSLSDYLRFKNGLNPDAKRFGKGIKFISVMDILNNATISYDCVRASVAATEQEISDFEVEYGDVLFQRSSETLEDIGRSNIYVDSRHCVFGGFVIRGKKIGEYEPYFMKYRLDSPYARKSIIVKGAGAQHFNIGQDGLSKVELFFPKYEEQVKIGDLLRIIDDRINTQSKIIEDKETLYKAISNILFSHYANSSPTYKLGDLANLYQPETIPSTKLSRGGRYLVYGANGIIGRYDKYNHEESQICLTCRGNTCGNINFSQPYSWITGNAMVINIDNNINNIDKRFLYHYMKNYNFTPFISGSGQPQIVRSTVEKLPVLNVNIQTQKKIASILDSIVMSIDIARKKVDLDQNVKKYLLKNLFI